MIKFHYENLHHDFAYLSGVTKDEAAAMFSKNIYILETILLVLNLNTYKRLFFI